MNIAAQARAAATAIECKKDSVRQVQCGDWRLTLTVAAADMPVRVITAAPGARYMLAIVEIGDDEQPVSSAPSDQEPAARQVPDAPAEAVLAPLEAEGPARAQLTPGERAVRDAGILCTKPQFQRWLWHETNHTGRVPRDDWSGWGAWTAQEIRDRCGVESRREFATNDDARRKWHAIEVMYFQETGQMAKDYRA